MNRRDLLKYLSTIGLSYSIGLNSLNFLSKEIIKRKVGLSNTKLPIVGLGTWQTFDVGNNSEERKIKRAVLEKMVEMGASVIDSSPMYGSSERVVGDLSHDLNITNRLFMATKVWTSGRSSGISQMERSMTRMQKRPMDLIQIHNLVDWKTQMRTLIDWKEIGKIKFIGITHYLESAYDSLEHIMKNYPIDFVQFNYSISSRKAEGRLLPLAKDRNIAVLINRPYEGGSLFRMVKNKSLPEWVKEFDCNSWGQFFLKYILANEAVTCVIPGTGKVSHLIDNLGAGIGKLPNAQHLTKMKNLIG